MHHLAGQDKKGVSLLISLLWIGMLMDDLPIVHQFSTCFSVTISRKKGKFTVILLRSPPTVRSPIVKSLLVIPYFFCWLAHLVGFNSEPKIFRRYEQVRFTTILGDYFRIFFGVSSRTGFEPSPTKTPWRSEEVKELMDVVRWFHRKTLLSVRGLIKGFLWRCWFKNDRDILKPCEEIDSRVLNLLNCSAMFCHVLPFQSFPGVLQVALLAEENERLREDCWQRLGQRLLQLVGES